jgi:GNAT superfamily N-acetyltransferase
MWWRLTQKEFDAQKGDTNRLAMHDIVASGEVPGILAYHDDDSIGWCSVAPREEFPRLGRSRILKPVDEQSVWSVVCFYVAKRYRRRGVSTRLLEASVDYVRSRGGSVVEGYAVEPRKDELPDIYGYHGLAAAFHQAGFVEVARRSETRPIMRYEIE